MYNLINTVCLYGTSGAIKPASRNILEFFGILLIFVIVLVVCWLTTKLVATKQLAQKNSGNFELIETYCIARERYLQLVRIGNKFFAISVSKDSVNVISEIPEDQVVLCRKADNTGKNNFSALFEKLLNKGTGNNENGENKDPLE